MERTLKSICRQHQEMSRVLEVSGAAAEIQKLVNANQHWQELATTTSDIAKSFAAHSSWLESIQSLSYDFSHCSQLRALAKISLCNISLRLAATERLMTGVNFEAIRNRFQIEMPIILGLKNSIAHMATSYGNLAKSLREISDITRLPAFVLPGATREIYTTSLALKTLHFRKQQDEEGNETEIQFVAEAELETSGSIALLQQIDPMLARPYIGARDALHGNNPDRARHILSSLRELWNHLLRQLAPDNLVAAWIPEITNQKDLLHEGKPTRRAKVLYICRGLSNNPLTDFVVHDTRALVKLIELFNRVHKLEMGLTDEQLRAIVLKADSWLMYILQISKNDSK